MPGQRAAFSADESWQAYRYLADNAIDVVLEASLETVIRWISPSVRDVLGWEPDELVGRRAADLVHPDDIGGILALAGAINERAARVRSERVRMLCADGGYKALQLRGRPALDDTGAVAGHIITMQDTSERDDALRALSVLSEGNRVLAHVDDEDTLLARMCETVATVGGYPLVWYAARVPDAGRSVARRAAAGPKTSYVDGIPLSWADDPHGQGPTGTCLRTGLTQVRHDYADDDPGFAPWAQRARSAGLPSSLSLPVRVDGEVDGALVVYADEARAFDQRAQQLLETLASDLGLGLHRLRSLRALEERTREVERQRAALQESEARYRLLAENSSDLVLQTTAGGLITWASESVRTVLGWEPEDLVGRGLDLIHDDDRPTVAAAMRRLDQHGTATGTARLLSRDGAWRWVSLDAHRAQGFEGPVDVLALRDIDAQVKARDALAHAIGHDRTTGLAARPTMLARIGEALDRPGADGVAVLSIGVDRLSDINEAFTHAAGDVVLATVAARIVAAAGSPDLVGRGAGVEFLVLVPEAGSADDAVGIAERVLEHARGDIALGAERVDPTVSVGIAVGSPGAAPEQLVRDASVALGRAKAEGRNRYAFADPSRADEARRRLEIDQIIRSGLAEGRFVPHFQPVVSLADGRLVGYEALVRLEGADGVLVGPADFIPVAERSSLISRIDLAVLLGTLEALPTLAEDLTVAVNLSIVTLTSPDFAAEVEDAVRAYGPLARRLHLEVTETALLADNTHVAAVMESVAELGARWYVDDFGTGYSSISHLRDLPVSGLKLDVSFSAGIRRGDATSLRLAQALAGLAAGLELDTVAEGVETEAEAAVLREHGWRHGQGWLFGRPAPLR